VAHIKPGHAVEVHLRPDGRVLTTLGSRTEFGSARALAVLSKRRGRWLGVTTPQLPNGALGWLDARSGALRYSHSPVELEVDLSRRQLLVRRAEQVLRRTPVSIGRAASPTPTGRFAVTDKLPGSEFSSVYGCCILALSGTQPNLPPGWTGGNRLAIHGTPDEGSVGGRRSSGCLYARASDLRWLMSSVPLGTPVRIHS
jgi:L,D-transpeptidase catalytic domain